MQELPEQSAEKLARVVRLLRTQRSLPARLETVVAIVRRTIPACDAAGVSLLVDGQPTSAAVSDRLAVEVDLVQYQTGEGPCLDAIRHSNVIRVDVMERDDRYSRIAPGALAVDVNSVLSVPLEARGRAVGALNMYSHAPDAFDDQTERAVRPLSDYAAEVIGTSSLYAYSLDMVDGLVETLESQALIAQATGVIMATEELTGEEALDRVRSLALASGEPMRTVAERLLAERPTEPPPAEYDDQTQRPEP